MAINRRDCIKEFLDELDREWRLSLEEREFLENCLSLMRVYNFSREKL